MLKIKIFISKFLQLPLIGKILRILLRNKIPFRNSTILTNSPYVTNSTVSNLFFNMYESAEMRLVNKYINKNLPVIELGSSIGVMAVQIGKITLSKIICVEANPDLRSEIEKNLSFNEIKNFTIISKALSYDGEDVYFNRGESNISGFISTQKKEKSISIPSTTLSNLVKQNLVESYILVCDIEGLEVAIFKNDFAALEKCEQIFIETHSVEYHNTSYSPEIIKKMISNLGFKVIEEYGPCFYFQKIKNLQ